ncbi:2,3-dihydroxybenzoate-AMP ligase [Streptomyces narbonensis]|uniref:(2,3-dihydroxybenzoyl)adenylate synthase n=1 Tax=Streptomyces narbonensis TaxID=67333 RepID=UPI0016746C30|nr:AMP-binding protein [Streptomyces narbonensis]GGW11561.1 2,3-dihydroxybenzoate-AMP ligase [Streptomyces narbonensis]
MIDGFVPCPDGLAQEYHRAGYWLGRPLGDLFQESCALHADRVAVVCGERELTYAELWDRVQRLTCGLLELGIRPLDRVVVQMPNIPEFVVLVLALLRAGAIPVLALPGHRRVEMAHVGAHSDAVAYAVKDEFGGFDFRRLAREVPFDGHVLVSGDAQEFVALDALEGPPRELPSVNPSDPALFLLSSGTTGPPKLIPRTHDELAYLMRATARAMGAGSDLVYLAVNPVSHMAALTCPGVLGSLLLGGKAVLTSSVRPDEVFPLIEREGVTVTSLVPAVLRLWADSGRHHHDLSRLAVQVGSAPLDSALATRARKVLGCGLTRWFGTTEGFLAHTRLDDPEEVIENTEGRPLSEADVMLVVGPSGKPLPDGEAGELLVRGPCTVHGYYRAPEQNARSFTSDGFYRTGDLACRRPDGNLVILGRIKDVINRAGEKISPEEVERHLCAHPAVRDAAVVGVPDRTLGERTYAFLLLGTDVPSAAVKTHLRERGLATYKIPDRIVTLAELPRTAMGKIDKEALRCLARSS